MNYYIRMIQGVCVAKAESNTDLATVEGWLEVEEAEYLATDVVAQLPSPTPHTLDSVWDEMADAIKEGVDTI